MNIATIFMLLGVIVLALVLTLIIKRIDRKIPRRKLNQKQFTAKWRRLQKYCATKTTWPIAVLDADKLVDEALKRRHFSGKGMGERLVAAQRIFTDNDSLWTAHKLRNKVAHEDKKLREKEVKDALMAYRQALRDLGALK